MGECETAHLVFYCAIAAVAASCVFFRCILTRHVNLKGFKQTQEQNAARPVGEVVGNLSYCACVTAGMAVVFIGAGVVLLLYQQHCNDLDIEEASEPYFWLAYGLLLARIAWLIRKMAKALIQLNAATLNDPAATIGDIVSAAAAANEPFLPEAEEVTSMAQKAEGDEQV